MGGLLPLATTDKNGLMDKENVPATYSNSKGETVYVCIGTITPDNGVFLEINMARVISDGISCLVYISCHSSTGSIINGYKKEIMKSIHLYINTENNRLYCEVLPYSVIKVTLKSCLYTKSFTFDMTTVSNVDGLKELNSI